MHILSSAPVCAALLLLAACGGQADRAADQFDNAAAQSDPQAAAVLMNAADDMREDPPANVNASVQGALEEAGSAQRSSPDAAAASGR